MNLDEFIGLEAATEIPVAGGSLNPGRLLGTYRISMSAFDHALTEIRRFQMADKPPSTDNSTPFTKLESSEARNSATVAISSG
jgi:hypothetical protein